MHRTALIGAAAASLVLGAGTFAYAQPYGPQYGPPFGAGRLRIVQSGPALACQSQQGLGRVLTAYADGNRWRAREAAQSCAFLAPGTRVVVVERPAPLNAWQFQARQTLTYRDVLVRVVSGPDRGYVGYMLVDALR